MNHKISKKILNTALPIFLLAGLSAFPGYKQPEVSGKIAGTLRAASLKAKSVVTPKADLLDGIWYELAKFIKKL